MGYTLAALPEGILAAGCRALGWLVATIPSRRKRTLFSNLSHAFPEKSAAWRRTIGVESAQRSMEMGIFVLASPYFSQKRLERQFSLHADLTALIKQFQNAPGPLIVLVPHFSLMEAITLLPMFAGDTLPQIGVVYRPFDMPALERWVKHTRERWGLRLLSRKEGYYQAVDLLRHGGAVALLFDQNAGDRGALSLFCGRVCSTSELAGLLAEKCRARVGIMYAERHGFMRAVIRGEYLDVPAREETVLFAANHWLENKLQSSDETCADWLWLHSRWRHQDNPARRFRLESKRNLLPAQLSWLGQSAPPRRTRFFLRLPNWLGDVVMALPLLRALRHARPDAEITLLALPAFVPLLERLGVADRFIALPPRDTGYFGLFRELRKDYPDTHILFTHSVRGDFEAWLASAPQRFGMARAGLWRPLLTHRWTVPGDLDEAKIHQTRVWEKFFQHFGLKEELDLKPFAWAGDEQKNGTDSMRAQQDCAATVADSPTAAKPAGAVIGLICGTENFPEKRWPVERWRELIQKILAAQADAHIELFGTARDAEITTAVAHGFPPGQVVNRAGQTNLLEFADALRACAAVVCNDTGGMHLANVLGVPVVAVYGPTNPIRTGPIFDAPSALLQPAGTPATGGASLSDLPAEKVFAALKPWLAHRS